MTEKIKHQWAATGVSSYPLTHPIVGQGRFYEEFRHFIHLVDDEAEKFAHVFAVIAQWGVGKSRLGYELIAQINDTSRGWWVRGDDSSLKKANLFDNTADRQQYLGLYIRYSQVANDYNNVDNWFAYGLYKALLPLAWGTFDDSIQGQIAKEASDRLSVAGFDPKKLAEALEVTAHHSDQTLYEDLQLAVRLCQAAYAYLQTVGVKYVLVVLDELETAAETSTYGLEDSDLKHMDGRAIKLMGKAIKEEDPRRRLPWLRYVTLCSPAIGDELREIQSTARRFEVSELQSNAFADVSDFVEALAKDGRIAEAYPEGLVEAAYTMSAGNFGWFNVIMASVDERLRDKRARGEKEAPTVGGLFDELIRVSGRVRQHVLDHHAIDLVKVPDRAALDQIRALLYGQLPVAMNAFDDPTRAAILAARNEYDEPVATLFRRVEWDPLDAAEALRTSKFARDKGVWRLGGIDQPLDLRQLLSNLGTYAIHETGGKKRSDGKQTLLIPLQQSEFVQLVLMLYPHPAGEDAARSLWRRFVGAEDLDRVDATHVGPSVEMIARLDLRHRKQGQSTLIFRDPDQNAAHEKVLASLRGQSEGDRARQILIGAMRVIDRHWPYDATPTGIRDEKVCAIATSPRSRGIAGGGLVAFDGLKLHPKGRAVFAYVRTIEELERLCGHAAQQFGTEGRTPVVAFTNVRRVVDQYNAAASESLRNAKSYLMFYQLSSAEEHTLHQVGIATADCAGFRLDGQGFTTAFNNRLQGFVRPFSEEVVRWRQQLDVMGRIAWPLRVSGRLKDSERELLIRAWRVLLLDKPQPATLAQLDGKTDPDVEDVKAVLAKLGVTPAARSAGYVENERAGLFSRLDDFAEPRVPAFLVELIRRTLNSGISFDYAEREWFWGYTWEGTKPRDIYFEWVAIAVEIGYLKPEAGAKESDKFEARNVSELRNAVKEADNWLNGEYPQRVAEMKQVFGEERVNALFASGPPGQPGTKTLDARRKLGQASGDLDAIGHAEASSLTTDTLRRNAERRRRIIDNVQWVFDREAYGALQQDPNAKTLDFESDEVPLWQRIRRASHFVAFVSRAAERIAARVANLSEEMRGETNELMGFPLSLFTLSLKKIDNILEGALAPAKTPGETQKTQANEAGTLRHNLRDLRVGEAKTQLEKLAGEVGVDFSTWKESPLEGCDGQIVSTFHDLKSSYEKLQNDLSDTAGRLIAVEDQLQDAPKDFLYPTSVAPIDKLRSRPALVQKAIEALRDEDVERLRTEFDTPARLGNFEPLMSRARDLLQDPRTALASLLGNVVTLENAVAEYHRRLLQSPTLLAGHRGMDALSQVTGSANKAPLSIEQLSTVGSLRRAQAMVTARMESDTADGEACLKGSNVSFERWCAVVAAFDEDQNPDLESGEAEGLVKLGLIQRTYRLGRARV